MNNQRNITIIADMDGRSIVVINDIRFRGKSWDEWDEIEEYLRQYVGECYEILETSENVFIGEDFPKEFTGSEYTTHLWKGKKHAKANVVSGIPELINTASAPQHNENMKQKHQDNARFGWYSYKVRFALPVYRIGKSASLTEYKLYSADMLVRHDKDDKKYLYDIINIERAK